MLWWAAFTAIRASQKLKAKMRRKKTLVLNLVYAFNLSGIFVDCVV